MTDTATFVMSWFILILGLSYLLQPGMWLGLVDGFFNESRRHIVLPMMMFLLVFGLAVIVNHNIWELNLRVVITIFGWSMAVKGALYMLYPKFAESLIPYLHPIMKAWITIAGVIISLLGLMLVYQFGLVI